MPSGQPAPGARLRAVAVYCGTNRGADPAYAAAAASLGRLLAERGIRLVYGGGRRGLMGILANAALDAGGAVLGVITSALVDKEVAHRGLTELTVVGTMHERKAAMSAAADAFIMLPGGYGTLEEFFEALTWTQLGIHAKPCGILDVAGYFAPLMAMLDTAKLEGFVIAAHREVVISEPEPGPLLDRLAAWTPVIASKWVDE
jgi:uncharacterized protein (TIGR00730 family)